MRTKALSFKITIWCILLFFLVQLSSCYPSLGWPIRTVFRPINQILFGTKTNHKETVLSEYYEDYKDSHPNQVVTINGYKIKKTFVKKYHATGYVAWVDINDALLKEWYLSASSGEGKYLYTAVAPIDLSLIFGRTAEPENVKKLDFYHEENMLGIYIPAGAYYNQKETTNIHVIPATPVIKRILRSLHRGDIVTVSGYLTDWSGTGNLSYAQFETARTPTDVHKTSLYGGRAGAGLCKQLYLTEITLNGYVYK